jgi:DNA end-binding protein Ku
MKDSGKVALARVTMRSKQHLACLRVFEQSLVMETMYYPKEIRHMDAVWEHVDPTEAELAMARQLIDNLARPFEPEKFHDEVHEKIAQLIESKVTGASFKVDSPTKVPKVVDIMEALRASIALTEKEKGKLEKTKSTLTPRKKTAKRTKEA